MSLTQYPLILYPVLGYITATYALKLKHPSSHPPRFINHANYTQGYHNGKFLKTVKVPQKKQHVTS